LYVFEFQYLTEKLKYSLQIPFLLILERKNYEYEFGMVITI